MHNNDYHEEIADLVVKALEAGYGPNEIADMVDDRIMDEPDYTVANRPLLRHFCKDAYDNPGFYVTLGPFSEDEHITSVLNRAAQEIVRTHGDIGSALLAEYYMFEAFVDLEAIATTMRLIADYVYQGGRR